ncbi:MAG: UDP-N-acetylglucosamine--N-acetylmuramyl-(pentapeptide) pyrophosphoryl-undecaprenol N-acetylglucosamine transferase [Halobacteriovoraceae bacterium]|nr:UDP-N-acetylglucosamine--N-acetylmuramyl-(pentapeptide) pyrophosphoryl-undecaprenol N-acetylglucosamine transferase [Halobacteriovoraceae bacterium]
MKIVVFTGGGSGGHVIPAVSVINKIRGKFESIHYIGGQKTIEKEIICEIDDVNYHSISTGKLRRYLSFENVKDFLKFLMGIVQSFFILLKLRLKGKFILFSTGGYVSLPPVIAAKLLGQKVYIHEQTSRVGLANKIASYFSDKIFISFKESAKYFPKNKTYYSGYPVRDECFNQSTSELTLLEENVNGLPVLFVTGGGNGAVKINDFIISHIEKLSDQFFIIHQVGKLDYPRISTLSKKYANYKVIDFISQGMIDLYKKADVIISRAGAGTVCELLALKRPSIFIPLKIAQKNEQFYNAKEAVEKLGSVIIEEDELDSKDIMFEIDKIINLKQAKPTAESDFNSAEYLGLELTSAK